MGDNHHNVYQYTSDWPSGQLASGETKRKMSPVERIKGSDNRCLGSTAWPSRANASPDAAARRDGQLKSLVHQQFRLSTEGSVQKAVQKLEL